MRLITAFSLALALQAPLLASADRPSSASIDTSRKDKVVLSHEFRRGQSFSFTTTASQTIESLDGIESVKADSRVTLPVVYEVQRTEADGSAVLTLSAAGANVSATANGRAVALGSFVDSLRSSRVTRAIRRDGTIAETTGTLPSDSSQARTSAFVADLLAMHWVQFPAEPLAIGESWLQSIPLQLDDTTGKLNGSINARYTLVGFSGQNAVIDATYEAEVEGSLTEGSAGARTVRVSGRGRGEGYVLFDPQGGVVVESGSRLGLVNTFTETNGIRRVLSISSQASTRRN